MVSVVIPCYNAERYIADTIRSVLVQSYSDWELIVSDDGSTDRSMDVVRGFRDPRISYVQHPKNTGWAAAMNRGIQASSSPLIALLAADDLLTRTSLERRVHAIAGVGLVCGGAVRVPQDTTFADINVIDYQPVKKQRYFYGPTIMIRRALFEQYGLFDTTLRGKCDREMWVRLFGKDRMRTDRAVLTAFKDVVGCYRIRLDSVQRLHRFAPRQLKEQIEEEFEAAVASRHDHIDAFNTPML